MSDPDVYLALTPFGAVSVEFPEEGGTVIAGNDAALAHLRGVMSAATNGLGASITDGNLEPRDLVFFCQPAGSGVTVIAPPDLGAPGEDDEPVLDSTENPALARARAIAALLAGRKNPHV